MRDLTVAETKNSTIMSRMSKISDRLNQIKDNVAAACVRAGRDINDVKLVVVSKTAEVESIKEVIGLGYYELGENRISHFKQVSEEIDQFLLENKDNPAWPEKVNWHMIGHLQRKKVKASLKMTSLTHSVDTLRLAEEINTTAGKMGIRADILLQVNCSGEPQKYGSPVGAAKHLAEQFATMPNLRLIGMMTMAPLTKDKDRVRACFVRAREIFEETAKFARLGSEFKHLSMGMSQDYEIAVEEGATMIRIGSAIFS